MNLSGENLYASLCPQKTRSIAFLTEHVKMMKPFTKEKRSAQGNYFRHRVVEYIFSILLCTEISSGTVQNVFLFTLYDLHQYR